MTYYEIKVAVASIFDIAVSELTKNGQDLFVTASNQVRRQAELNHDFEFSRKLVTVSVNGVTGGSLENAVVYGTNTLVDVKSVIDVGLFDSDMNLRPVTWTTVAAGLEQHRQTNRRSTPRYPTDDWFLSSPSGSGRFQFTGDTVYRWPKDDTTTFSLGMEVYSFQADWNDSSVVQEVTDVWTKYASQFIQWAVIVQLNHLFKHFVFRQEGNLPPPEKLRDEGLQAFIDWDSYRYEQNRRHGR